MNIQELQELKDKIEKSKADKAKAEGSIEQIEKTWKDEFECNDVNEVEAKIKDTEGQIKALTEKLGKYTEEIETAMEGV